MHGVQRWPDYPILSCDKLSIWKSALVLNSRPNLNALRQSAGAPPTSLCRRSWKPISTMTSGLEPKCRRDWRNWTMERASAMMRWWLALNGYSNLDGDPLVADFKKI